MRRVGAEVKSFRRTRDTLTSEVTARHTKKQRGWHVIHACEYVRDVQSVVEAQLTAGMSPYVLTARGEGQTGADEKPSLLQAWQGVRTWRKNLDECRPSLSWPGNHNVIVHAHSFTAGMAAVRGENPAVYDVREFVEEQAPNSPWLTRSFRTAEQFVLNRASAVVAHTAATHSACLDKGVNAEDLFFVPDPVPLLPSAGEWPAQGANWLHRMFGFSEKEAVAVVTSLESGDCLPSAERTATSKPAAKAAAAKTASKAVINLFQAFAEAHSENEMIKLFVVTDSRAAQVRELGRQLELDHAIFVITPVDSARALATADIVLDAAADTANNCADALPISAMVHGRALLAPDVPATRGVTPEGRGCLWYKPGDKKDLAHRLAFLARNRDFRLALGESGRKHIIDTRSPERVGQQYAEVYRRAQQRRKKQNDTHDVSASLVPTTVCL